MSHSLCSEYGCSDIKEPDQRSYLETLVDREVIIPNIALKILCIRKFSKETAELLMDINPLRVIENKAVKKVPPVKKRLF